ncbi:MAG: hypothetical protein AB3A66_27985 (plasmid) [Nodularia sp. CChRGM 3473]
MNKLLLFITLLLAGWPSMALAQMRGYLGADGFFSIRGLQPSKSYSVDLGGMPLIRVGNSNSCGVLRIAAGGVVKLSDKIEIHDVTRNEFYGFENNSSIPIKEFKCITGQVKPEREIWKDAKGTIWISGLTPSRGQTIRLLSENPKRNIRANQCGFISLRLANPQPSGLIIDNSQAFSIDNSTSGGGIVCRRGKLYISYPAQPTINPVSATQWRNQPQNQINFYSYTSIASISGSTGGGTTTTWNNPPSQPPPLVVVNPQPQEEEPPPPEEPPEEPPPPPPPPPPPEEPPPPPPEPPPPPSDPRPPYGRACRINGGNNVLVIGLKPNTMYEFSDQEHLKPPYVNFRKQTTDSEGKTTLANIDFTSISWLDGESNWLVAYENGEENYDNIISYGIIYIPNCI